MNKLNKFILIVFLVILSTNLVYSLGGGDGEENKFNPETFQNAITNPEATATIPEGATYTSPSGETYEGPGEMTGGKYSGKVTPKGYENPVDTKGATFKNGQIASAEELTINGQTYKDVTDVKKNADGGYDIKTAAKSKPDANTKSITTKFMNRNSNDDKYNKDGNLISSGSGQSSTAKDDSGKNIFSAINYEGLEVSEDGIHIGEADSFTYDSSTSTFAKNIFIPFDGTFRLAYADQVIIDDKIFNKVKDSKFELDAGELTKADIISAANDNKFKLPPDIQFIGDVIIITAQIDQSFIYESVKEAYYNNRRSGIRITLDKNNTKFLTFDTYDNIIFR